MPLHRGAALQTGAGAEAAVRQQVFTKLETSKSSKPSIPTLGYAYLQGETEGRRRYVKTKVFRISKVKE